MSSTRAFYFSELVMSYVVCLYFSELLYFSIFNFFQCLMSYAMCLYACRVLGVEQYEGMLLFFDIGSTEVKGS